MSSNSKTKLPSPSPQTPTDVLDFAKKNLVRMVDFKFTDPLGTWQHLTMPLHQLNEETFESGVLFDGSSIRGWRGIQESDMMIRPDLSSVARLDPFTNVPTLSLICNAHTPETSEPYNRDPRQIAKKAISYLKSMGIADTAYFGPEAEFFIFDDIRYDQSSNSAFYALDAEEAHWNSGRDEAGNNLGYKTRHKEGYFPALPHDTQHNLRTEICLELEKIGMIVERQHHEVATAQGEINFKYDSLVETADNMMWFKYIVKNIARRYGKTATFMPKPLFGDNGSGMHCHVSLWKDGKNLFAGDKYAGLSQMGLHFIGGVLKHAPAMCAFTNPSTNSYKRLVPGFEAPIRLAYSYRNRSAAIRIPSSGGHPNSKRIEYRTPDPSANIYLCLATILMAGLDGILNKINPGEPLDKDIYGLPPQELANVPSTPDSLGRALELLQNNSGFLRKGDVFTHDFIETWIHLKHSREVIPMQQRPSPYEFSLYYDV